MNQIRYTKTHRLATMAQTRPGDAGFDLTACDYYATVDGKYYYDTGVKLAIPEGYVGLLMARSSIVRKDATLANSIGVIDSNYRGNVVAVFTAPHPPYEIGERCCQLVVVPCLSTATLIEDYELNETNRGQQGFGSSGK